MRIPLRPSVPLYRPPHGRRDPLRVSSRMGVRSRQWPELGDLSQDQGAWCSAAPMTATADGRTENDRWVFAVYVIRPRGRIRVLTARDMTEGERRLDQRKRRERS